MNPILSPGIDIVQPGNAYLLRDEFSVDVAAGSVNGTKAVPGPGTRTVVDLAGNNVSILSGNLLVPAGSGWSDTYLTYSSVSSWSSGLLLIAKIKNTGGECLVNPGTGGWDAGFLFSDWFRGWGPPMFLVPALPNVWYDTAVLARTTGHFIFIKQSTSSSWILCRIRNESALSSTFGALVQCVGGVLTVSSLRVPAARWLPTPLVSHGFGSAFATSDGAGHAEGVAGGIGSGGAGAVFSNAGNTWSVAAGKAINTPSVGAELITNGNMETGDPPTGWESAGSGILDGVADERTGGSGSQSLSVENDAGHAVGRGEKASATTVGTWYELSGSLKKATGSPTLYLHARRNSDGAGEIEMASTSSSWTFVKGTNRCTVANWIVALTIAGASASGLLDDASLVPLTLSELISLSNLACADVFAGVAITRSLTTVQAGLALNWNSPTAPTSGIIVYLYGGNIVVDKCVAGTWTNVSATAYTYSAGARLVCSFNAGALRVYYNNALVTSQTVTDAAILTGTYHGLFSTDSSNTFDDLTIYATGSSGEYNALNAF